jgi:hypothetical protein
MGQRDRLGKVLIPTCDEWDRDDIISFIDALYYGSIDLQSPIREPSFN